MIDEVQYFAKRHTSAQRAAVFALLQRVEWISQEYRHATGNFELDIDPDTGTEISGKNGGQGDGGFRTPDAPGAPDSSHKVLPADAPRGAGVDKSDQKNLFDRWLDKFEYGAKGNSMLEKYDLYREHPSVTPTWVHFTTRAPASGKRTFMP